MPGADQEQSATKQLGKPAASSIISAAKAVVSVSGTAGTLEAVLERHALGHYAQGLRQYLAIRAGSTDVKKAFSRLRSEVVTTNREELLKPPGIRARLYKRAREIALESSESRPPPAKRDKTLAWFRPASADEAYVTGLMRARQELPPDTRELLELRFARELQPDEIAYVLGEESSSVEERLKKAVEEARTLFAAAPNVDLPHALLQSFALERLDEEVAVDRDPTDPPVLIPGTMLDDRYKVEAHVGAGGFADVYRCIDIEVPGHQVALKLLKRKAHSQEQRDAALRELRLIAAVFHPSVTQFKDHGWFEGRFWFVMPWYEGESLESRIERGPLSRPQAKRIFVPLARALATMHAAGIRHQDVKPDNIFLAKLKGFGLEDDERVLPVLLDLGVAATDAELILAGTPTYFAPEVAEQFAWQGGGEMPTRPIGPAADIFSLALSLRNALEPSTQPDVAAGAVDAFIRYRAMEAPEPPASRELRFLDKSFRKWMSPDPADRPTADELAEQLEILTMPEERRARRLRVLRVFGPLVIATAVVFGAVVYELQRRAQLHSDKAQAAEQRTAEALAELDEASAQADELALQIGEAEARIQTSQLSRQELADELAQAQGRLAVATRNLRAVRRDREEIQKNINSLQTSLQASQAQVREAQARVESLEGTVETRDRELVDARRNLDAATARAQQIQSQLDDTRRELSTAQNDARRLQSEVSSLTNERDQAQAQLQRAQAQIRQLQQELEAAQRPAAMVAVPMVEVPMVEVPTIMAEVPSTTPGTTPNRSRMATRR